SRAALICSTFSVRTSGAAWIACQAACTSRLSRESSTESGRKGTSGPATLPAGRTCNWAANSLATCWTCLSDTIMFALPPRPRSTYNFGGTGRPLKWKMRQLVRLGPRNFLGVSMFALTLAPKPLGFVRAHRQAQDFDLRRPAPQQHPGGLARRGSRREHVIDEEEALSRQQRRFPHPERSPHIGAPAFHG